jgi:ribosome-binding ATPase
MQLGLIGMPLVGKTTLFELMTGTHDKNSNQNKANSAMVKVPDDRIDYLVGVFRPKKTTYAQLELIDIPGLMPGQEKSANIFLDSVRKADALLQVIRLFDNQSVPYIFDTLEPMRDINTINYELLLADLDLIEKRIERINANKKRALLAGELELLGKLREALENERPISSLDLRESEQDILRTYQFLTDKPMLLCLNLDEKYLRGRDYPQRDAVMSYAAQHEIPLVEVSASIENEIAELDEDEKELFLEELGIDESGLTKVARMMYHKLGLISFFTVGEDEVKAWTIEDGTNARKAAGKIHSDIERGFIRAEVVDYQAFKDLGSMNAVKEKGLFRLEGKEYVIKDGEIVHFRFNI